MYQLGIYEIGIAIRDSLRENITDPISRGTQWIHYDTLDNIGSLGKTPAIFIEKVPGDIYYEAVGTSQTDDFYKYEIHIVAKNTDKGLLDSVQLTNSNQLIDKLTSAIRAHFKANDLTVDITSIVQIHILDTGGTWSIDDNTKAVTLDYEVQAV